MSTTKWGRKRQAPTESSKHSETNENLSVDDGMSVPGTATYDGSLSQISGEKPRRKRFSKVRRKEVAMVRKHGACEVCRSRKVRCRHALSTPDANVISTPTPKQSNDGSLEFETSNSGPYPETTSEGDAGIWPQLDEMQSTDLSLNEGSEMIPASIMRQAGLGVYLDDLNNVISGETVSGNQINQSEWGQNSPWMMNATALLHQQSGGLAQVNNSTAGPYVAGMLSNTIAVHDEDKWRDIYLMSGLRRAESPRASVYKRTQREPRMRQQNSPMQRQTSISSAGDMVQVPLAQQSISIPRYRNEFITSNLNHAISGSASEGPQHDVKRLKNLTVQHATAQFRAHRSSSPAPSLIGQFANGMQISDQSDYYRSTNEIGEETQYSHMQPSISGLSTRPIKFPVPASVAVDSDWSLQDELNVRINEQGYGSNDDLRHKYPEVNFMPGYHGSSKSVTSWPEQAPPTAATEMNDYNTAYTGLNFQSNNSLFNGFMKDESLLTIPLVAGGDSQPSIMLNSAPFPLAGQDAGLECHLFNSIKNQNYPQQNSIPHLAYSTMSSSGTSESLLSPVDAPNSYNRRQWIDGLDYSSDYPGDFNPNNTNINTNDEQM